MSKIAIFDSEYITVEYLADKGVIHHTIHKPLDASLMMDAMNAGTEALATYGASKWLSDDRNNGPVDDPEVFGDWIPRTIRAGWKYWANVVPEDVASAASLMPHIEACHKMGLHMAVFTSVEKAMEWLDKQQ